MPFRWRTHALQDGMSRSLASLIETRLLAGVEVRMQKAVADASCT